MKNDTAVIIEGFIEFLERDGVIVASSAEDENWGARYRITCPKGMRFNGLETGWKTWKLRVCHATRTGALIIEPEISHKDNVTYINFKRK